MSEEFENPIQTPSAPPADDNGFLLVQEPTSDQIDKVINTLTETITKEREEISKIVDNIVIPPVTETETKKEEKEPVKEETKKEIKKETDSSKSCKGCTACPYYLLGFSCIKNINLPPKVRDLILWKDPKFTGAVFGTSLVLLFSLATFSLLSVIGTLLLLAISAAGIYRFYLSVMFRIKGTYDDTFDKLSAIKFALPKDKVTEISNLIENDINKGLHKLKSIILWDNIGQSFFALTAFYIINSIGCVFNSLTLIIFAFVGVFTLPKVYQVYQTPIDQALAKAAEFSHNIGKQVAAKLPFLHKKKSDQI